MRSYQFFQDISQKILRFWWLVLLGGLVGSFVAYFSSLLFLPPIYIAQAEISVTINFKEVGDLTQYEQDQLIGNVMSLFRTDEVVEKTIENINDSYLSTEVFSDSCSLERQVNAILFSCKSTDPTISADWSTNWAMVSHQVLSDAYIHALNYESLKKQQNSYESCVERSVIVSPSPVDCIDIFPEGLADEFTQSIQKELLSSKNIYPGIRFSDVIQAAIPTKAIRFQTNYLVLSGAIFGFLISLYFILYSKNGNE